MATNPSTIKFQRRQGLFLVLTLLALYVLLPQLGSFKHSLSLLRDANWQDLILAIVATAATYFAASGTYCLLAFKKLQYARTVLVQVASMFANRLLPAGIGGISANYAYLRKSKHTPVQAGSVVTANNLLGLVGHLLLVCLLLALFHNQLPAIHVMRHGNKTSLLQAGVVVVIVVGLFVLRRLRHRLQKFGIGIVRQLGSYRKRPERVGGALLTSICLTLGNVASLYFCSQALGGNLPFISILLVFTLGIAIGTATPTPGGLGGIEAGLVAGLVAYHLPGSRALAIVLAYRLISYWLALVVGAAAFVIAQRRGYFSIAK